MLGCQHGYQALFELPSILGDTFLSTAPKPWYETDPFFISFVSWPRVSPQAPGADEKHDIAQPPTVISKDLLSP